MLSIFLGMALGAAAAISAVSEIEAAGPDGPLKGTMILPAANAPVVLIIPGSGPTDRDGNSPLGVNAGSYRLLAEELASNGVGSVRIDKRGMFGSDGAVTDANAVTIDDYVRDVDAWTKAVRATTGRDCIWLLGHSEGGLVALAASAKVENICGLILVATAGRPLGEVLKEQLRANPANKPVLEAAEQAIDELSAGRRVDVTDMPPELGALFNPSAQGYLISVLAFDPANLADASNHPMLILQGDRDLQVPTTDADRLKAAAPDAKLVHLPDTNHVLKRVTSDDRSENLATYGAEDLPLADGVTDAIVRFVKSR
ncbi:MAG: alpha/beta fold hydrolase [Rhizobiaceae bacterium]|nr:alpha/beta fold hydrolase [Rhizobiaceae bacterium]